MFAQRTDVELPPRATLYRHDPTGEALVEAAYRIELPRLCDGVDDLITVRPPDDALRARMDRFIDDMTTNRGKADVLRAVVASVGDRTRTAATGCGPGDPCSTPAGRDGPGVRADVAPPTCSRR